ncbi:MAG: DUF58 domain-containing protein [Treponema sp.]|nr:DUF58 domain-containing protein [Treponema sp.]
MRVLKESRLHLNTLGFFFLFAALLAFIAGQIRKELVLTLLGAVFLVILFYCFIAVLFLGLVHRKRGRAFHADAAVPLLTVGEAAEIKAAGEKPVKWFRLPGTLLRYGLKLETRDGKKLRHIFDPALAGGFLKTEGRGAYFGTEDEFFVSDAPGFFRFSVFVEPVEGVRLLVAPTAARDYLPLAVESGGTEHRIEPKYRKTDDLTDHRPYVPGDDPRRINWKLYGHGPQEELFVREGESEPPPHSRLLILIDTQADEELFTLHEARVSVDMLCENALAAALEFSSRGIDILIGYTGGKVLLGSPEDAERKNAGFASALSWPAALPLSSAENLPDAPEDRGVLILALPRTSLEGNALDRFLRKRLPGRETDLHFLYPPFPGREWGEAAKACLNRYSRRQGIHPHVNTAAL